MNTLPGTTTDLGLSVPGRDLDLVSAGREAIADVVAKTPVEGAWSHNELVTVFSRLQTTGYLGSTISRDVGGAGLSLQAFASLLDGISTQAPFLSNHSVQRFVAAAATDEARQKFLEGLLNGTTISAVAVTESHGGSDLRGTKTSITGKGGTLVLSGSKTWVTHGMAADVAVVLATQDGQSRRVLVDLNGPGVTRSPIPTRGLRHLSFADLDFRSVEIEPWRILRDEGAASAKEGFAVARSLVAVQVTAIAFEALSVATHHLSTRTARQARAVDLDLITERIGSFSARLYAARLLAYQAVVALDEKHPDAAALSSGAKAHATSEATAICTDLVGLCAAAGMDSSMRVPELRDDAEMLGTADGTGIVNAILWGSHVKRRLLGVI